MANPAAIRATIKLPSPVTIPMMVDSLLLPLSWDPLLAFDVILDPDAVVAGVGFTETVLGQ
jgi:hypothetical protein